MKFYLFYFELFYQSQQQQTITSKNMSRRYQKTSYLHNKKQKISPLTRYNSVSFSNNKVKRQHRQQLYKPYYIMETDSGVLPKYREKSKQNNVFKKSCYLTHRSGMPQGKTKKTSKDKSSVSKSKTAKNSRQRSKHSKSLEKYKGKSVVLNRIRESGSKQKSQKSRSTKKKKHPSTNQVSHQKISKSYKGIGQKSKSIKNKKTKNKGTRWEQILEVYGQYLTVAEIAEIRQVKIIYFLGKIRDRKQKQMLSVHKNIPYSDRKHHNVSALHDEDEKPYYNQLLSQRKHDFEGDNANLPEEDFYRYEQGDHIAYRYQIISSINKGAFGQVLKVFDHKNRQYLALKIVKKSPQLVQQTLVEISLLTHVNQHDKAGISGIVKIKDFTIFRRHICIIFELLDRNLYELIFANNHNGFDQDQIRLFAIQMLNSLNFMRKEKIIHCDLKPENIVLQKQGKMGIKIIDFGTGCFYGKQLYEYLQSRYYRAPEIILGTGYSYPIDMWSIGCILAELRLGQPIFAGGCDVEQLMYFANAIGMPQKEQGLHSRAYLDSVQIKQIFENQYIQRYRDIKSQKEIQQHPVFSKWRYIRNSMVSFQDRIRRISHKEDDKFVSFLEKILMWEPDKRYTPEQALSDPWITNGLSKQMKKMFLTLNVESRKTSKSKSKDSKKQMKSKDNRKRQKSKSKSKSKEKNPSKSKQKKKVKSKDKIRQKSKEQSKQLTKQHKTQYQKYFHKRYSLQKHGVLKAKLKGIYH